MPENTMGEVRMGFFLHDMPGGKVGGAIAGVTIMCRVIKAL